MGGAGGGFLILQVVEELFGFGVVGGEGEGFLGFGAGQGEFVLLHVDAGERGANDGGIAALERRLKLGDGVIEFVATAIDFGEAKVSGGVGRIGRKRGAELSFGQLEAAARQFLTPLANVRCCGCVFAVGRNRSWSAGGQDFETQSGDIQIGLDAIEMRLSVTFGIDVDRRQRVGAKRFGDGVALFVGFGFFPGAIKRLNQQGAIFGVVGLALDGLAE